MKLAESNLKSLARIGFVSRSPRLPDLPVTDCNEWYLELTGYDRHEVLGKGWQFLMGLGTDPEEVRPLKNALEAQVPIIVELLCYKKDGTRFVNAVMAAPNYDDTGELVGFLFSHIEVTDESRIPVSERRYESLNERRRKAREIVATLSPRKIEVLKGLSMGKRTKVLAYELGLAERTVKMHRTAMLKSLGVKTNAEAIRLAVEAEL